MIYLPTYRLAKLCVLGITKIFRLYKMYYKLFASLFQLTGSLIFNFGVFPTIKVIWNVFIAIYRNNKRLLSHINLIITYRVLEVVGPYRNYCIKNPGTFKILYHIYVTCEALFYFLHLDYHFYL